MPIAMLSRLWSAAVGEPVNAEPDKPETAEALYPTLSFPPPPPTGTGTRSVCSRCLTLLSHVLTHFGDGTDYGGLEITHSSAMQDLSTATLRTILPTWQKAKVKGTESASEEPSCLICIRTYAQFEVARAHVSFEASLRGTPAREWELKWEIHAPSPRHPHLALPHDSLTVFMSATHKGGYGWSIGGSCCLEASLNFMVAALTFVKGHFEVCPDSKIAPAKTEEHKSFEESPLIGLLDPDALKPPASLVASEALDFSSTLSTGSISLISSWARECRQSHKKCNTLFRTGVSDQTVISWFPDRLIRIKTTKDTDISESGQISSDVTARMVLKSNSQDFLEEKISAGIAYLSLSHCWGLEKITTEPLGGRADTVLTQSKLSAWQEDIPLHDLPLTFQHAIGICVVLGCDHIWIDSLCIIQDSLEDWQAQSAIMGDVYKFAWLNIAALSCVSDYDGFINDSRDPRLVFGFRAPFGAMMGDNAAGKNYVAQDCILLRGVVKLIWMKSIDVPGPTAFNSPLYNRGWVHQERNLARRTIGFTKLGVYWSCDEFSRSEEPGAESCESGSELRSIQHRIYEIANTLASMANQGNLTQPQLVEQRALLVQLLDCFDSQWHATVTQYTLCKLTKHTDNLIAISSIARELAAAPVIRSIKYLAGLWDFNLISQLSWITVDGKNTPLRKMVGETGYVAPSWSWASIEAPIQPRNLLTGGNCQPALAEVRASDVVLETGFAFGSVKAGWLRIWGCLRRVKSGVRMPLSQQQPSVMVNSMKDLETGEDFWFNSDTVEGIDLIVAGKDVNKLVWMPLILREEGQCIGCTCLVLAEVERTATSTLAGHFAKPEERLYRRLGTGNFGRIPTEVSQDTLLMSLGTFPDVGQTDHMSQKLLQGFKRSEDGYEAFVLI